MPWCASRSAQRSPPVRRCRPRRPAWSPPPSAWMLAAAFAAPPSRQSCARTSSTGTGASGEIRETSPRRYSSSITSPTTTTRQPRSWSTMVRSTCTYLGSPVPTALQRRGIPQLGRRQRPQGGRDRGPVVTALGALGAVGVGTEPERAPAARRAAGRDVGGLVADDDRGRQIELELARGGEQEARGGLAARQPASGACGQ